MIKSWKILAISAVLLFLLLSACTGHKNSEENADKNQITGEYFNQTPPGKQAELFASGIMSTGLPELNAVFFPDKKEVIFSVTVVPMQSMQWRLVMMKEVDGRWSDPQFAEFNKEFSGVDPFVSHDGNRIYFCSNRPVEGYGDPEDNFDIWYTDRTDSGWSEPINIGAPINSDAHDFYPTLTLDRTIYFQSRREGGFGQSDIYFSKLVDGQYLTAERLPEPINSEGFEGDVMIAPDESYLILSTSRENEGYGRSDLWISFNDPEEGWSDLINMGPNVNSEAGENCQILSPCGRYLFFTSRRTSTVLPSDYKSIQEAWKNPQNTLYGGDIYWVDIQLIGDLRIAYEIKSGKK